MTIVMEKILQIEKLLGEIEAPTADDPATFIHWSDAFTAVNNLKKSFEQRINGND